MTFRLYGRKFLNKQLIFTEDWSSGSPTWEEFGPESMDWYSFDSNPGRACYVLTNAGTSGQILRKDYSCADWITILAAGNIPHVGYTYIALLNMMAHPAVSGKVYALALAYSVSGGVRGSSAVLFGTSANYGNTWSWVTVVTGSGQGSVLTETDRYAEYMDVKSSGKVFLNVCCYNSDEAVIQIWVYMTDDDGANWSVTGDLMQPRGDVWDTYYSGDKYLSRGTCPDIDSVYVNSSIPNPDFFFPGSDQHPFYYYSKVTDSGGLAVATCKYADAPTKDVSGPAFWWVDPDDANHVIQAITYYDPGATPALDETSDGWNTFGTINELALAVSSPYVIPGEYPGVWVGYQTATPPDPGAVYEINGASVTNKHGDLGSATLVNQFTYVDWIEYPCGGSTHIYWQVV